MRTPRRGEGDGEGKAFAAGGRYGGFLLFSLAPYGGKLALSRKNDDLACLP